jgi:hypothetical protein
MHLNVEEVAAGEPLAETRVPDLAYRMDGRIASFPQVSEVTNAYGICHYLTKRKQHNSHLNEPSSRHSTH